MNTHPIFFSVSHKDIAFAEEVWAQFPAEWTYLYSKSGVVGADMWEEISERELPSSKLVVVFWSKNFSTSKGCLRELKQASTLKRLGLVDTLVIRLDHFPIFWKQKKGNRLREVYQDLEPLLASRTTTSQCDTLTAASDLRRLTTELLRPQLPKLQRPELQARAIQAGKAADKFKYKPGYWFSGFVGSGRRFEIGRLMSSLMPNSKGFIVEIDESTSPKQALLRLTDLSRTYVGAQVSELAEKSEKDALELLMTAVSRVQASGDYCVFNYRGMADFSASPPEWLETLYSKKRNLNVPQVFFCSDRPIDSELYYRNPDKIAHIRIPSLSDEDAISHVRTLIGYLDEEPERWSSSQIEQIATLSQGNIGLLCTLCTAIAGAEDVPSLNHLVENSRQNYISSVKTYVRWALQRIQKDEEKLKIICALEKLSPMDVDDLRDFVEQSDGFTRTINDLSHLGIIERQNANLIRLSPILMGLMLILIKPKISRKWLIGRITQFAQSEIDFRDDDNTYHRIESRIDASLAVGDEVPQALERYVLAAHWFKAGIKHYRAQRYFRAFKLLSMAFKLRDNLSRQSRVELLRFLGLVSVRIRDEETTLNCISLLNSDFKSRSLGTYLDGYYKERNGRQIEAIKSYKESLSLTSEKDNYRRSQVLDSLIRCGIKTKHPRFEELQNYSRELINTWARDKSYLTNFRLYLHWHHSEGDATTEKGLTDARRLLINSSEDLTTLYTAEAETHAIVGDYTKAAKCMMAIPKSEFRSQSEIQLLSYQAASSSQELREKCISRLEYFSTSKDHQEFFRVNEYFLTEHYIKSLMANNSYSREKLERFTKNLEDGVKGHLVKKVREQIQ